MHIHALAVHIEVSAPSGRCRPTEVITPGKEEGLARDLNTARGTTWSMKPTHSLHSTLKLLPAELQPAPTCIAKSRQNLPLQPGGASDTYDQGGARQEERGVSKLEHGLDSNKRKSLPGARL